VPKKLVTPNELSEGRDMKLEAPRYALKLLISHQRSLQAALLKLIMIEKLRDMNKM
jgi:hypothetical protein